MEDYYKKKQKYHIVLELPHDIKDRVGSGSLVIELGGDIRESEGWQEQLKYAWANTSEGYTWPDLGHAYKLHREKKNWTEAETECQKEGGHLASVTSKEVNEELKKVSGGDPWIRDVLLGGKQESGVLSWSDNSTWAYTNWMKGSGKSGEDYYIWMDRWDGSWYSPGGRGAFICQIASPALRGKEKLDLTYKKDHLAFQSFHVWYQYKAASHM